MTTQYNGALEKEALDFIKKMTGHSISPGKDNVQRALKDGKILADLANKIKPGSVKYAGSTMPFKQMEAISGFLNVANQYLPSREMFMTIDLFEGQNMAQVILCLANLKRVTKN